MFDGIQLDDAHSSAGSIEICMSQRYHQASPKKDFLPFPLRQQILQSDDVLPPAPALFLLYTLRNAVNTATQKCVPHIIN